MRGRRSVGVHAAIIIERDGEEVDVEITGSVSRGESARLHGHPDTWHDGSGYEVSFESAEDGDGKIVTLTDAEQERAIDALRDAGPDDDGPDYDGPDDDGPEPDDDGADR